MMFSIADLRPRFQGAELFNKGKSGIGSVADEVCIIAILDEQLFLE